MLTVKYGESFSKPCVLLLGGFDGLHKGHATLLNCARRYRLPVGIMTIIGGKAGNDIFTLSERGYLFEQAGISFMIPLLFSQIRDIAAEDFLNGLFSSLSLKAVVCGEDFRFGKGAAGNAVLLKNIAPCPIEVLPISMFDGRKISASTVKEYLLAGNVAAANAYLEGGYFLQGKVEYGRQVGRRYGFPTANVHFPEGKLTLCEGVYRGITQGDFGQYPSIINFGACPTFGIEQKKAEAYLHGFEGDLYGKTIRIYPQEYIRPIVKFSSEEELKIQLHKDLQTL